MLTKSVKSSLKEEINDIIDEVCLKMNAKILVMESSWSRWLWIRHFVQEYRIKRAAKRFFKKLLKELQYCPRVIITDKLRSHADAKKEIMPKIRHRQHCYLNNRAENSRQATRNKEKQLRKFKSPRHAQLLLFPRRQINNLFKTHRHKKGAGIFRTNF